MKKLLPITGKPTTFSYSKGSKIVLSLQTIWCLRGKRCNFAGSIKDQNDVPLHDEVTSFTNGESISKILNLANIIPSDAQEVQSGEGNIIIAVDVFLGVKTLKVEQGTVYDEIRPKIFKILSREGVLWLTRLCPVAWHSGKTPKDWLIGMIDHPQLAVKSLYSCSEICVHVGGVKSQPFTVGVGLRQGCVLSPLLFMALPINNC